MKALIIYPTGASEPAHSNEVKDAFIAGGGIDVDLYNITLFNQDVIDYAKTNNYDAIIYSYSGEDGYFSLANSNPDIMIFMPSDSYNGDLQQLVLTDYTPTTDDYEFCSTYGDSQSNSNGYICGQLFYIAEQRNCSLQEARICANATKSEEGIINVNSAINYNDGIKLQVKNLSKIKNNTLNYDLILGRIIDATNYEIKIYNLADELLDTVSSNNLTINYVFNDYGRYKIKYRGYNANITSDWSEVIEIKDVVSLQIFIYGL